MFNQSIQDQLLLLIYSVLLGVSVGFLNNIFDAIEYLIKRKKVYHNKKFDILRFILDLLFSLIYTLIAIIFAFGANSGKVRFFIVFFALCGFVVYYLSLGRLVQRLLHFISDVLFCVFGSVSSFLSKILHIAIKPILYLFEYLRYEKESGKVQKSVMKNICDQE